MPKKVKQKKVKMPWWGILLIAIGTFLIGGLYRCMWCSALRRKGIQGRNVTMRRFTLLELMAMTGTGCMIVITIAVGHIAGWW